MLCGTQLTIPNTAGTSHDPLCDSRDTKSSQLNQSSRIPDSSCPLVFATSFPSSYPTSLVLIHNSPIVAEYKLKSSLSISTCHNHELTPSTAYTKCSIHHVQHTLSTVYTKYSIYSRYITKMYFSHWKPPGVSERMWSVNLDTSISGEYQTLWGHSRRHSEYRESPITGPGAA